MNIFFPAGEIVDRYCIAKLKFERTQQNQLELDYYQRQIDDMDISLVQDLMQQLFNVHVEIWNLESFLRSGLEQHLPLEEIGKKAIEIRNWNGKRVQIKNLIAQTMCDAIIEIKQDHISQ